ncbi:MAG TPA: tRNA (adenosine(37)-N6)-threonylcarbamoyltransferase complex dimerization subunit type 1 TsaB [Nocardioidaceae bacterium]|nr:tRNA (adenosine(37)-N6)-threonylcarbamoyltransferase complex dimerization subunit type 1 TsaB [Nocardioidaceae bacterium]
MLLLAFDTATPSVSVALHDGSAVVAQRSGEGSMRHAELLAPGIVAVLDDAGVDRRDLTDVAVGVGPGPYTGLRVGVVTARTLAAALGVRLHGVCTLDVIAAQARRSGIDGPLVVATDARRKEVYWARYDSAGHRVTGPAVDRPAELAAQLPDGMPVVGRGARLYGDMLTAVDGPVDPDAGVLAELVVGGRVDELDAEPLYLRRPDVREPGPRKRVS